jgi:phosphatidylserine/phosphatidylglycerophosphate/cardiolipin synthase-like enzyme
VRTFSNNDSIYIGRNSGTEILNKIKTAKKSVKIVSPYLSASYIKELVHQHKNGIDITLITCDKISDEARFSDFRRSDLIKEVRTDNKKGKKTRKLLLKISLYMLMSLIPSTILGLLFIQILILAVIILGILMITFILYFVTRDYSITYKPIFRIKVFDSASGLRPGSTELIHSKIFVIDNEVAFLGSANFTYSGFKTHYETVIKIEDSNAVNAISQEVESLYTSPVLRAKPVEEWAFGE